MLEVVESKGKQVTFYVSPERLVLLQRAKATLGELKISLSEAILDGLEMYIEEKIPNYVIALEAKLEKNCKLAGLFFEEIHDLVLWETGQIPGAGQNADRPRLSELFRLMKAMQAKNPKLEDFERFDQIANEIGSAILAFYREQKEKAEIEEENTEPWEWPMHLSDGEEKVAKQWFTLMSYQMRDILQDKQITPETLTKSLIQVVNLEKKIREIKASLKGKIPEQKLRNFHKAIVEATLAVSPEAVFQTWGDMAVKKFNELVKPSI